VNFRPFKMFLNRLPASLELALGAILLAVASSVPMGLFAAIKRGTCGISVTSFVSLIGLSAPRFWVGIILILIFSLSLRWFPVFGRDIGLFHGIYRLFEGDFASIYQAVICLVLPATAFSYVVIGNFSETYRANVIEELDKLYVKTAREKGIGEKRVILFHIIRNACIPVITIIALNTGRLIGGAVIVETVFAWPGVGQLLINALWSRDYPVIQATICIVGVIITSIFFFMDIIYMAIDPRIRSKNYGLILYEG